MKILIIRFSSLGDIVLTEPIVRVLRRHYPEAEIHYLTKSAFLPLLSCMPGIDRAFGFTSGDRTLLPTLKAEHYDLVLDLHAKLRSWSIRRKLRAKKTVVYHKQHWLRWRIVHHLTKRTLDSTLRLYEDVLRQLGIQEVADDPVLVANPASEAAVDAIMVKHKIPLDHVLVGIFPGATHFTKRWPVNYWTRFLEVIPAAWNVQFLLLGAQNDRRDIAEIIQHAPTGTIDLGGEFDISGLVGMIDRLHIVLGNDSGPMHLAAALRKPQIAIFGGTHPALGFRPLNPKAVILQTELKCRPCSLHGQETCPKKHFHCMNQITPALLKKVFRQLLQHPEKL